jgi:hypothetical protein
VVPTACCVPTGHRRVRFASISFTSTSDLYYLLGEFSSTPFSAQMYMFRLITPPESKAFFDPVLTKRVLSLV